MNRTPNAPRPIPTLSLVQPSHPIPILLGCLATAAFLAPVARGDLFVDLTPSMLGGGLYRYEASVNNTGPKDIAIVSLVDAPANDPLIASTLFAPTSFSTSYDAALGIIDLLPDFAFSVGTITSGFSFQTANGPGSFLNLFEALTIDGDLITGRIRYRTPGVPDGGGCLTALLLGIATLGLSRYWPVFH